MITTRWVYRQSDRLFLRGGFYIPDYDPAIEGLVELGERHPDPRTERYDPTKPAKTRPATPAELASFDADQADAGSLADLDVKALKTLALVVADLHSLTPVQMRNLFIAKWKSLP